MPVKLHPDAEEVAGFFGSMLNSAHNVENPTFQKNFFEDFREILKKTGGATDRNGEKVQIKEFSKCDFKPIFEYYDAQRAAKAPPGRREKGPQGRKGRGRSSIHALHVGRQKAEGGQLSRRTSWVVSWAR